MIREIPKMIAAVATAGLVTILTGCRHAPVGRTSLSGECVCEENLRAHLATILCQPLDVEVASGQTTAVFEVKAVPASAGDELSYQWYFNDSPIEPTNKSYSAGSMMTPRLIVLDPSTNQAGFYHCEIDSTNANGASFHNLPQKTRTSTRWAALGLAGTWRMSGLESGITTPTQPLPPAGSPQKSSCNGSTYCTWVSFYNGGNGYPVNQGVNYITIMASGATVPNRQYFVEVYDFSSPHPICSTLTTGSTTCVSFPGVSSEKYVFTVCFLNSTYCKKLISMNVSSSATAP